MDGIILLALGANEYGEWSRNMAVSLRYHSPQVHITLLHDGRATRSINFMERYGGRLLYDRVAVIDNSDYMLDGKFAPGLAKTCIYKYNEYDRAMYIDVDGLCVADVAGLFDKIGDREFTSYVWGFGMRSDEDWGFKMMWSTPQKVWRHFNLDADTLYPFINSSLIAWQRDGVEVFEVAEREMRENPMDIKDFRIQWGKANQPDELYFNAALAKLRINPSAGFDPILFRPQNSYGSPTTEGDLSGYYFLGSWGDKDMNHRSIYNLYDKLMTKYAMGGSAQAFVKAHQLMKRKFIVTN